MKGGVNAAERLYAVRRGRDAHFPPDLFGEPAWDLLLALQIARGNGRTLGVSEALAAAGVNRSTGRRLLAKLEGAGLIERRPAPSGHRRVAVELTADGRRRLDAALARLN